MLDTWKSNIQAIQARTILIFFSVLSLQHTHGDERPDIAIALVKQMAAPALVCPEAQDSLHPAARLPSPLICHLSLLSSGVKEKAMYRGTILLYPRATSHFLTYPEILLFCLARTVQCSNWTLTNPSSTSPSRALFKAFTNQLKYDKACCPLPFLVCCLFRL